MTRFLPAIVALALAITACSDGGPGPGATIVPASPSAAGIALLGTKAPVTLYAADTDDSGDAIATGDFNDDGVKDVVFAAAFADGPGNERPDAGEAYVFLGPFARVETRDAGAGQQDATIFGADEGDQLGRAAAAGDFNGDGIDDVILGAPFGDGPTDDRLDTGEVHVIFGSRDLGSDIRTIDLRDGRGLAIYGRSAGDLAGFSVITAKINGDNAADLVFSAFWGSGPNEDKPKAGEVYSVFGSADRTATMDLATAEPDVTVYGAETDDRLGESVAAGDVNGDGLDDLVLPAPFAASLGGKDAAGRTYVIYSPPQERIDLATDEVDSVIYGVDEGDQLGHAAATGDVDGDGSEDILLTAVSADGQGNAVNLAGEAALILGDSLPPKIDVAAGEADALVYGASVEDRLGRSGASGDIDGDGRSDLLLGAPGGAGPDETSPTIGELYVLFGPSIPTVVQLPSDALVYYGKDPGDSLASSVFGRPSIQAADLNEDGAEEILVSAPLADGPDETRSDCGEVYILFVEAP